MILPFLQIVVPEVKRLARAVAVHDPHKRDARWWRVTIEDTWDYGVRVSGDRRPDGLIKGERAAELLAADVEYPGPPVELVDLLSKVELIEVRTSGLRVRGVAERYGPAWDKQKRRAEAGHKGANARWNHAVANSSRTETADPKTKKKTEKEKEKEIKEDDLRSSSAGRRLSRQELAFGHFQRLREAGLQDRGLDPVPPDEQHEPAYINSKLKPILDALGDSEAADELFSRLASTWLDGDRPATAVPPYPFRMFAAPNVWQPLLERVRGES